MENKVCTKCLGSFPAASEYFYRSKTGKEGLHSQCKQCMRQSRKEYKNSVQGKETRKKYRESPRSKNLRRGYGYKDRYNITIEMYEDMLQKQDGKCAICGNLPAHRKLVIDHNHETGQVRKLLCIRCNTALGWVEQYGEQFQMYVNEEINRCATSEMT